MKLLKHHLLMDPKHNPERLCITCLQEFPPGEGWTQYLVIHCIENRCDESPLMQRLSCKICPAWFKTMEAFTAHILGEMHIDMRLRYCPDCDTGFTSRQLCVEHVCQSARKALGQTRDAPEKALPLSSSITSSNDTVIGQDNPTRWRVEGAPPKVPVAALQKSPMSPRAGEKQHGDTCSEVTTKAFVDPGITTRRLIEGAPIAALQTSSKPNSKITTKKEERVIKHKIVAPDPAIFQRANSKTVVQKIGPLLSKDIDRKIESHLERRPKLPSEIARAASQYYAPLMKLDSRQQQHHGDALTAQSAKVPPKVSTAAGQKSPVMKLDSFLDSVDLRPQQQNIPSTKSMTARQNSPMLNPDSRQQQKGDGYDTPMSYTSFTSPRTLDKGDPLLYVSAERFEAIKKATLLKLAAARGGIQPSQPAPAARDAPRAPASTLTTPAPSATPRYSATPATQPSNHASGNENYIPPHQRAILAGRGSLELETWVRPVEDSKEPGLGKTRSVSLERASQLLPIETPNFTEEGLLGQGELGRPEIAGEATGSESSEEVDEHKLEALSTYVPRNPGAAEVKDHVVAAFGENKRVASEDSFEEMLRKFSAKISHDASKVQRAQEYQQAEDDLDYQDYKKAQKLQKASVSPPTSPKAPEAKQPCVAIEVTIGDINDAAAAIDLTEIPKVDNWRFKRYPCFPHKCTSCRLIFNDEKELRIHHAQIEHKWEKWCKACDTIVEGEHPCAQWTTGREWAFADRTN
jgi:hypothetical protein